jgi:two-component system sensor histidine kinase YesM
MKNKICSYKVLEVRTLKVRKNHSTLRHAYYRSFLLLVVIPLILVFVGAEIVIGYQIRTASIATIDALQENISTSLRNDLQNNALQLSHFVYVNDGEFTETAVRVHNSKGSAWYDADQALQRAFRTAMGPSQSIVGGAFYMRDGGAVYMKETISLSPEKIRQSAWYSQALAKPNTVVAGVYDTGRMRLTGSIQKANQMVIVTAMATDRYSDKSGEIEVASFYTISRVSDVLLAQHREGQPSRSVILDKAGNVVYGDMGNAAISSFFRDHADSFGPDGATLKATFKDGAPERYYFRAKNIPDTAWSVVTFTPESHMGQRFYQVGSLIALIVAILLLLFYLYSRYFLNSIITPIHSVVEGMVRLDNNDLEVQLEPTGQQEIQELIFYFNQMVRSIQQMITLTEKNEQKKHQAEIQALQSQINPHFIVNTLNSIRFMAQVAQFEGIRKMAEALVTIVSCSFRSNDSFYTVREELDMLKTYEYLMQIRYSNSFEVDYQVDEDCLDYLLPRLILQPVMENAITHGVAELVDELGQIRISVSKEDDFLCLSVWDNGQGIEKEKILELERNQTQSSNDNRSIGLKNVLARLRLNFGPGVQFLIRSSTDSPDSFTHITFKLPLETLSKQKTKEENHD